MEIKTVKLSEVKSNPNNPRIIKDDKFGKLVKSIKEFPKMLEIRPIVVNADMIVLGGNMRLKACKEAGLKEVPVIFAHDLTEEEQKQFIIKDNVGFGEWDWDIIANEWDAEQVEEWGLDIPEFSIKEELEAEEDDYEMPDEVQTDIVLGDLFEIGDHRLLCGDSTCSDTVAKLMNGQKADMVFTDPPYGIKVVNNTSVGGGGALKFGGKTGKVVSSTKGFSEIIGDDTTDTAREFYDTCISLGFENFIIFGGNYFTDFLPPSMGWIVWYKKNTGNFADFEMAWTSFNKASRLYEYLWNGLSREGSRELELVKRVHPTQKPVGLNMQILQNYNCDIIYDGFTGSGSTMVAAHQLMRKCYGMELDPKYCQVIVDRMKKLDPSLVIKKNGITQN
jgi:DNA modification methylase